MLKALLLKMTHIIPDALYLKLRYYAQFHKKLNLKNPRTFNEKIQWLKLYDRRPEYSMMVDKYEVKKYIADTIGEEYIIPTLNVWNSFDEIDFDTLPNQFVLKCTHDSGGLVICTDKATFDKEAAKKKIEASMKAQYFYHGREWSYKSVKPRIIAEQYIEDETTKDLRDYKFFCFNGFPKCSLVCSGRNSKKGLHITFFDLDWNIMPVECQSPSVKEGLPQPKNYKKMLKLAQKLSESIPFVRVDFYEINNNIYFGELTFYPCSGLVAFEPHEWDEKLGDWIKLPPKTR